MSGVSRECLLIIWSLFWFVFFFFCCLRKDNAKMWRFKTLTKFVVLARKASLLCVHRFQHRCGKSTIQIFFEGGLVSRIPWNLFIIVLNWSFLNNWWILGNLRIFWMKKSLNFLRIFHNFESFKQERVAFSKIIFIKKHFSLVWNACRTHCNSLQWQFTPFLLFFHTKSQNFALTRIKPQNRKETEILALHHAIDQKTKDLKPSVSHPPQISNFGLLFTAAILTLCGLGFSVSSEGRQKRLAQKNQPIISLTTEEWISATRERF